MTFDAKLGRILPPDLDDRTWQDLVDQMRALIPRYAPGWTDHNPSDLGITLLELFAWLAEGIVYRLNQVPDKNYIAFLNLLGVTRDPPTPARTFLTFVSGAGPVDVAAGSQASTAASAGQAPMVFETDEDVHVVPQRLDTVVQLGPFAGTGLVPGADITATLVGPPAGASLLSLPAGQTTQLCIGFDAVPTEALRLGIRLVRPATSDVTVTWTYSTGNTEPLAWKPVPTQAVGPNAHAALVDATAGLAHNGDVVVTPQPDWGAQRAVPAPNGPASTAWTTVTVPPTATSPRSDPRFWLGLKLVNTGAAAVDVGVERLLFNAARASTALTLRTPEILGTSTGDPFQTFQLSKRPLYRRPDLHAPYADLVVEVGSGVPPTWEAWSAVDDLPPGAGKVFLANPVTGEISFGDHDPQSLKGHGSMPPAGSPIRARYRYVAQGAAGNVAAGQVVVLGTAPGGGGLPGLTGVGNLAAAGEGTDEEPVEDTLRRAPDQLKIRDRAITAEDYEFLAREASNEVVITRCLTPKVAIDGTPWTYAAIIRAPGNVNVVVVPDQGPAVTRPAPTPELLAEVLAYLDQRRDVGAHVQVTGPRYCPIVVSAEIVVWRDEFKDPVHSQTLDRITAFLHPTRGGADGAGWQVGQPVFSSDLFQAIMPASDLGYISSLQIKPGVPPYVGSADPTQARPFWQPNFGASVRLTDYELVCAADPSAHTVTSITQAQ
ncbi:MAG TPA: putative baseplate assembly protein [Mycobacteriales bacterium]|jgi:predicted phage baseplate assembly protein